MFALTTQYSALATTARGTATKRTTTRTRGATATRRDDGATTRGAARDASTRWRRREGGVVVVNFTARTARARGGGEGARARARGGTGDDGSVETLNLDWVKTQTRATGRARRGGGSRGARRVMTMRD